MSKKKNKVQKRKFFGRPENRKKVFKRKEKPPPEEASKKLRERGYFEWIADDSVDAPHCSHGPCLLFLDKKENKRIFACAVYRCEEKCGFRAELTAEGSVVVLSEEARLSEPSAFQPGNIPKKLKTIPRESELVFCTECNDVFEKKHKHPAVFVTRKELRRPSQLLAPIEEHAAEAQFWFSDASLAVVVSAVAASAADGVLCVGAPRLFETLRNQKNPQRRLFMLDYDSRYSSFYPRSQFGRYSMLVDWLAEKGEKRLLTFLSQVKRFLIVCDPPFGVFIQPLMHSIQAIRNRHRQSRREEEAESLSMLLLPLFVGKHALKAYDGDLRMSDYRVCYQNHKDFSKPNKSIVRIFTDLPHSAIDLSQIEGYRFCDMCERHVAESNIHCGICGDCTSRDGSRMRHCDVCMRCFKASYRHCLPCGRCHLSGRCLSSRASRSQDQESFP